MQDISHYLRFGSHKEAKIFKHLFLKGKPFGIALNANVVAHTPASIYKMIFISFPRVNYFIDPQTYILQVDPLKYYSSEGGNSACPVLSHPEFPVPVVGYQQGPG